MNEVNALEAAALGRLIAHAKRDSGQSRYVADFLLAWWNPAQCGGFDLTCLWGLDEAIAQDLHTVFGLVARMNRYPDSMGYAADFAQIIEAWRPELAG